MAKKMTRFMMKRSQSEEDGQWDLSCICLPEAKSGQFWGPVKE